MELRHLRYFVAVAEKQNVTRAAVRLRVSQPPLSRQIRNLEDELGIALFNRDAKTVRLTEAGRVFLTEARVILQRADDAVQMAKAVAEGKRGEIHVGYAPSLTVELLPRILKYFRESNPGVRVQLHDLSTQEMLRGLADGKLQVALLVRVSPKALAGLVFEELQHQPICVAMYPAHPLVRERRVGLEQIAKERLIAFTRTDYPEHHTWITDLLAPLKRLPQIVEEHDSITSLIAAVESGRGVAVIAQPINGLASPRLKIRPLQPAPPPLAIGIAYSKKFRSTTTDNFIDAARLANAG
jgi:LysR family transcriptional regulator, benzoate and cis,cis-muconate-responsive activator of ben and cat genes